MIRKIILAVTLAGLFVITFAIGVGFIIAGAGDFSWDIVSQYVSMSEITKINDTPISNLFSFSDHSEYVGSHAEGQIGCPTEDGIIIFENIPEEIDVTASPDEYIHLTFDGKIRLSSSVKSAKNLTGNNVPDIQFEFNKSTDEAIIKIRKLRCKEVSMKIELPADYVGNMKMKSAAGKLNVTVPLKLAELKIDDAAGSITTKGVSAKKAVISNVAGDVSLSSGVFNQVSINDSLNNVSVSGTVGTFDIESVLGKFKRAKKDVVGIVTPLNGDKKADCTISVEDIIGKVSIKRVG